MGHQQNALLSSSVEKLNLWGQHNIVGSKKGSINAAQQQL